MPKKDKKVPDSQGRFGAYGGVYVAETLVPALEELAQQYELIKENKEFKSEVQNDLEKFVGLCFFGNKIGWGKIADVLVACMT